MTTVASRAPAYVRLYSIGELARRAEVAVVRLAECDLCARDCRINRLVTIRGAVCRTGRLARAASYGPHYGEERPLSGWRGSGTIFFAWCNLRCVFCQNWEINQREAGEVRLW